MAAPTTTNRRPWAFIVVTAPTGLARLRNGLPPVATALRWPCCLRQHARAPRSRPRLWIKLPAATQNILLAATGLGLGAVWIGVHPIAPLRWHVAKTLELPKWLRPLAVVHIGHPAESKSPRTQYEEAAVHWQLFGGMPADLANPVE